MTIATPATQTEKTVTVEDESDRQRTDAALLVFVPGLGNVAAFSTIVGPDPAHSYGLS
jgi:hypothetical protein